MMKNNRINFHALILFLLTALIVLAACEPGPNIPPSASPSVSPTIATSTATKAAPTQTKTPEVTATSMPAPVRRCPARTGGTALKSYGNLTELDAAILDYVNHGGDPASLKSLLVSTDSLRVSVAVADLDGDALDEIVVSESLRVINEDSSLDYTHIVNIYQCGTNVYRLVQSFPSPSGVFGAEILFVDQIFQNEPPLVVVEYWPLIGWGQPYNAFGWREDQWTMINLGFGLFSAEIMLYDQDSDGIKEVLIYSPNTMSLAGGAGRFTIDVYTWNGKEFEYSHSDLPPGNDRVHYLGDAEDQLKKGNPMMAIAYFEIAAWNQNLSSYPTMYELTENQREFSEPYQKAYAFFRIVVIWFSQNRVDMADQVIHEMSETFPEGTPGSEFVVVSKELAAQYEVSRNATTSCLEAVKILDTEYPNVLKGHIGDWGFDNVSYNSTSEFCKLN